MAVEGRLGNWGACSGIADRRVGGRRESYERAGGGRAGGERVSGGRAVGEKAGSRRAGLV